MLKCLAACLPEPVEAKTRLQKRSTTADVPVRDVLGEVQPHCAAPRTLPIVTHLRDLQTLSQMQELSRWSRVDKKQEETAATVPIHRPAVNRSPASSSRVGSDRPLSRRYLEPALTSSRRVGIIGGTPRSDKAKAKAQLAAHAAAEAESVGMPALKPYEAPPVQTGASAATSTATSSAVSSEQSTERSGSTDPEVSPTLLLKRIRWDDNFYQIH